MPACIKKSGTTTAVIPMRDSIIVERNGNLGVILNLNPGFFTKYAGGPYQQYNNQNRK
jgi:hypothetical protein